MPRQPVLTRIKTVLFAAAVLRDAANDLGNDVDQSTGIADEATDAHVAAQSILGRLLDAARVQGFTAEELGVETLRPFEDIYDAHTRVEEVMGTEFRPRYAAENVQGGGEE